MHKLNVSKHILVPKHIKISQKEKEVLFEKYNVTIKELPKIHKKDPALKGMDVKLGDIIKIIRESPTAKNYIFYRGVANE